jgi:protease-4
MMAERILVSDLFRNTRLALANRIRLLRRKGMDYVVMDVKGGYPERTPRPQRRFPLSLLPWPPPPPSVESFTESLERLALDPRVKGVVLLVPGLAAGPATVASLRDAIARFRRSGKQAIAYLNDVDMWSYYLAVACDQILVPESGSFRSAGLWSEVTFLRDTLALAGIKADFEALAEYKVAPDMYRRSKMTEPHREMLESLLDSIYDQVMEAIADGRSTTSKRIRKALDSVPLTAEQARDAGLFDDVCYEDELPTRLGTHERPAALVTWEQAQRRLIRPRRWRSRRAIGVISLEGMIVPGPSRQPPMPMPIPLPIPSRQAGSDTLVQQLRAAAADRRLAAIVVHVDSPGGSALASGLIWREIAHLRRTKPVVVYMSNVAASGGYYVSAGANAILAQPLTLTGSIGIFGGKIVTKGLYDKIHAHREVVSRGKSAGLYSDMAPFSDEERERLRADIGAGYERFKARVAEGRDMTGEQVETIARGRVWTGKQALEHHLVDELGDLFAAAKKAGELAQLSPQRFVPLVDIAVPKSRQLPQPFPVETGEWLAALERLSREGVFAMAPWEIRIRG